MNLDVLVLGAGPAGSVLAHRLASRGFQVAVVESQKFPRYTVGETLTPGVESLLKQAQVLSASEPLGFPRTTGNLSAWGSSRLHYSAHSQESKASGFQVERAVFDSMLMASAQRAGASLLQSCWPTEVHPEPAGWRVKIQFQSGTSRSINARFLCDATGRSRFLARRLRLGVQSNDRLVALTAYWKRDAGIASADGCNTLVESIPEGWFYTAGLAENRQVTGFMTDRDLLPARLHSCARRVYADALARTKYARERMQRAASDGLVRIFAANPSLVERVIGSNWLLVGDAASTVDPVSSQGIQKAITSALAASVVVQTILTRPNQAGPAIEFYQDREETTYRSHVDSLARLYSRETRWIDQPFWTRRSPHAVSAASQTGDLSQKQATRSSLSDGARFRVSRNTRLLLRPVLQNDRIELQQVAVTAAESRGIRYCGQVCVPILLSLMEDGPNVLMLHDRYEKQVGTVAIGRLREVAAHLVDVGILSVDQSNSDADSGSR
jgi:flavin-dependent dehydrogenase